MDNITECCQLFEIVRSPLINHLGTLAAAHDEEDGAGAGEAGEAKTFGPGAMGDFGANRVAGENCRLQIAEATSSAICNLQFRWKSQAHMRCYLRNEPIGPAHHSIGLVKDDGDFQLFCSQTNGHGDVTALAEDQGGFEGLKQYTGFLVGKEKLP